MTTHDETNGHNGKVFGRAVRVLLVFDPPALRGSMAVLLASSGGVEVVGSVANSPEAIALATETRPDLVMVQVDTPLDQAKKTLARLKAASSKSRILVATNVEDPGYARELLDSGASAYLIKSVHLDGLIETIRDTARNPDLSDDGTLGLPTEAVENAQDGFGKVLSDRQMEVLLLATRGLSNRQIAASLNLSEATVSRHLANIYGKMDVSSRSEAAKMAMSRGWISLLDITSDR